MRILIYQNYTDLITTTDNITNVWKGLNEIEMCKNKANMLFTQSYMKTSDRRQENFHSTEYLSFDIDNPPQDKTSEIIKIFKEFVNEDCEQIYVWSGHGLQIHIKIPTQKSIVFFKDNKRRYELLCTEIQNKFDYVELPCKVDKVVFEPARLLRIPGTINAKTEKPPVETKLLEYSNEGIVSKTFFEYFLSLKVIDDFDFSKYRANSDNFNSDDNSDVWNKIIDLLAPECKKSGYNYALITCPFHSPDNYPSFIIFYNNLFYARDLHDNQKYTPYQLFCWKTAHTLKGSLFLKHDFYKFLGLSVKKSVVDCIIEFTKYKYDFTYKKNDGLYSEKYKEIIKLRDFKDSPDLLVIDDIFENSIEIESYYSTAKSRSRAITLFKNFAGEVYNTLKNELSDYSDSNIDDDFKRELRKILYINQRVPGDKFLTQSPFEFFDQLSELDKWEQFFTYHISFLKKKEVSFVALAYSFIEANSPKISENFKTSTKFTQFIIKNNFGYSDRIYFNGKQKRVVIIKLNELFIGEFEDEPIEKEKIKTEKREMKAVF